MGFYGNGFEPKSTVVGVKDGIDVTAVKLKQNPRVWVTGFPGSVLKNANLKDVSWVAGNDLNSSETFDLTIGSGDREILGRIETLRLTECL